MAKPAPKVIARGPVCTPEKHSLAIGLTFAVIYLLCVAVAAIAPEVYLYLGDVASHYGVLTKVGDLSASTVIAGTIFWFVAGVVLYYIYYYAQKICCK